MATTHGQGAHPIDEREQQMLEDIAAVLAESDSEDAVRIIGGQGHEALLTEPVLSLFRQIVHTLAQQQDVRIVPLARDLTTQEAADLLNVSRPYLIHLLDEGAIPYTKTGTHRRIRFDDVMRYEIARDAGREQALDELARLNQVMGLYDA